MSASKPPCRTRSPQAALRHQTPKSPELRSPSWIWAALGQAKCPSQRRSGSHPQVSGAIPQSLALSCCWNTTLQRMMHPWFIPVLEQTCWGHASHRMLKGVTLGAMSLGFLTQRSSCSALIFAPSKNQLPKLRLTIELNSVWADSLMFEPILFLITSRTNLEWWHCKQCFPYFHQFNENQNLALHLKR